MTLTLPSGRQALAIALIALVAVSAVAMPIAAKKVDESALNHDSDYLTNPKIAEDTLTKQVHEMGSMGVLEYENDNGDIVSLDASLNETPDNPFTIRADKINASDYSQFATSDGYSVINASTWSVGGANSSKGSVTDASVAGTENDAVKFATDGSMASGDVVTFTFDNADISTDASKRYAQLVANVNTLDSGTVVKVVATDGNGDDKVAVINSSRNSGDKDVIANATGSGQVYQHQLGDLANSDLTTAGLATGDGTFNGIVKITVIVQDGDATVVSPGINYEKMGEWDFGEQKYQADDDDELETKTLTEPSGSFSITDLATMGSTFDSATVYDVAFGVHYYASDLDAEDVKVTIEQTSEGKYPGFGWVVNTWYRLSVPSAYDLSHSGLSFEEKQTMPSDRYKTVEIAEGTGDTAFGEIDDSSFTDKTSAYSSEGSNITLDSSVQVGTNYVYHAEYVVTDSNKDEITQTGGAPAGGRKEGGNGIIGSVIAIIVSILGVVGLGKLGKGLAGRMG